MNINHTIKKFIYISIGAVPGVLLRWHVEEIYIVNTIGCFLIGLFNSLSSASKYKLIFCIGFCGSLTTFSGWILRIFNLISNGLYVQAFWITTSILVMGFFAVSLGNLSAQKIKNCYK